MAGQEFEQTHEVPKAMGEYYGLVVQDYTVMLIEDPRRTSFQTDDPDVFEARGKLGELLLLQAYEKARIEAAIISETLKKKGRTKKVDPSALSQGTLFDLEDYE